MDLALSPSTAADHASSGALWEATAVEPPATAILAEASSVDVLVIGGGFTGLSTALHLAEKGVKTAVLEARTIGFGASGRNGGQVNPGFKLDPDDAQAQLGSKYAQRSLAFSGSAPDVVFDLIAKHKIDCDAVRPGWLQPAHNETAARKLAQRVKAWSKRGVAMRMLDRDETAKLLGTSVYHGCAFDPRGGSVQPLSYARGLARAAIAAGAAVYENAAVSSLERRDNRWVARVRDLEMRAERVVIATNGYTGDVVPGLRQTVIAANSFQIASFPLDNTLAANVLPGGHTASDSRRIVLYFRKDRFNRIVIGGRGHFRDPQTATEFSHLRRALDRMFPQLRGLPMEFQWAGRVALTRDGLPHIHEPYPGMLVGLGYNGRGIAMATAMGGAFADYLTTAENNLPFPVSAISPIPFHQLQRIYLGAAVRWFMLRDAI
jgi:glycine/D-amino acid oxidase-like deaminating enzyme